MPAGWIPDYEGLGEMLREVGAIQDALDSTADAVRSRATSDAGAAGETAFAGSLRRESGVRPKGRPYARVIADYEGASAVEFGDTNKVRRRILGRAAGVTIFNDSG